MGNFLAFRAFITPAFIQVIFWIGVAVIVIMMLLGAINNMQMGGTAAVIGVLMIFLGIPLALIIWRVWCELVLVGFRMLDALRAIEQKLR
ncbi:MAG: DUF4282 domain-containing protein [Rhodospirillaceae bacterium]|nr:DUF4282 domain-containing protein [Rhodospirillaceae bacterium]